MSEGRLGSYARRVSAWSVAGLGLAIPISTAFDSVLLGFVVVGAVLSGSLAGPSLRSALRTPPVALALLLFSLLLLGCFWGSTPLKVAFGTVSKYLELGLAAVLLCAAARPATRKAALMCFAAAVLLNLYVSYTAAAGLPGLRNPEYPIGFKASVTHSLIISLGAFLFLLWARDTASVKLRVLCIALAALCAHNVLFITIGRTGYVVLALLLTYYVATFFKGWRGMAVAAAVVGLLAPIAYLSSGNLQKRVNEVASDLGQWKPDGRDATSVGQRLEYYRTTLDIITDAPLLGVGTGGFAGAYAQRVRSTDAVKTTNPHNDYLLLTAQVGALGFLLLAALYAAIWRYAAYLESRLHRDLARGLAIAFATGSLFNSFLLDHTEGLLLVWLMAVLYAGYNRASATQARRA